MESARVWMPTLGSVVRVQGRVVYRGREHVNKDIPGGEIEVEVEKLEVLGKAEAMPIQQENVREAVKFLPEWKEEGKDYGKTLGKEVEWNVAEGVRLKYRYLDLRRAVLQRNLRLRSELTLLVRNLFAEQNFVEIETPTLFKSTSEGAREFVVPTRIPGKFFALPQSPQQYKQLLMVSGIDRYFQIARCYRDEMGRADRQPEFTQIDLEMSFVTQDDVISLVEHIIAAIWKKFLNFSIALPLKRMKYRDAISLYGVDKPDLRYDLQICDISRFFVLDTLNSVQCLRLPKLASNFSRKEQEEMLLYAKEHTTGSRNV